MKINIISKIGLASSILGTVLFSSTAFAMNATTTLARTSDNDSCVYKKDLRFGHRDNKKEDKDIENIQNKLREMGYMKYKSTGFYGAATRDAVRKFQKDNNINRNGVLNKETREKLGVDLCEKKIVRQDVHGFRYALVSYKNASGTVATSTLDVNMTVNTNSVHAKICNNININKVPFVEIGNSTSTSGLMGMSTMMYCMNEGMMEMESDFTKGFNEGVTISKASSTTAGILHTLTFKMKNGSEFVFKAVAEFQS
jgi:hypothetical protein